MCTSTLHKQRVSTTVDLSQRYNDVGGRISKPKPTSLCYTLTWTTDKDKGDSKREKGRKAQGLVIWFIRSPRW